MSVVRKSITFTEQINQYVQSVVSTGDYANESEYIRDLIRHDRDRKHGLLEMRAAIQEGLHSGASSKSVQDIIREADSKK
jgi:antitoxin ParD1/3/4